MAEQTRAKRSLSGIKPTESPHWGNYFGMIRPALELAEQHDALYFIADYHALTTVRDAAEMRRNSYDVAATFLALGLDPTRTILWRQSDVPEVTELAWLLSCVTGFGLIERAHAFKDARAKGNDVNMGLVSYPVLMAADILLFDSDLVPVGKDQVQHVEMTRDMAGAFNFAFGDTFVIPQAVVRDSTATVPGLDGRKMSKSYGNHIPVFLEERPLKKRLAEIVTDSTPLEAPKNPDTCNVFALYRLFATPDEVAEMRENYARGGYGYGHAKVALAAKINAFVGPMRERYRHLLAHTNELDDILRDGARRAREIARGVIERTREHTGLGRRPAGL